MLNKKLTIALLVLPIVILILIIAISKPKKTWEQEGRVTSPRDSTLSNWASSAFVSLKNPGNIEQAIQRIPILATNITLNTLQIEQLRTAAYNFLMAYHLGDFEAYAKFRLPVTNGACIPAMIDWYRSRLQKAAPSNNYSNQSDMAVLEAWWNYSNAVGSENCTKCVQEVSFDGANIYVEHVTQNPRPLNYYVTSFANVGYMNRNPSFKFDPSPEAILQNEGKLTVAVASLIFRFSGDPPYPLYCKYYWVDRFQKWLPMELCSAYAQDKKWYYIF